MRLSSVSTNLPPSFYSRDERGYARTKMGANLRHGGKVALRVYAKRFRATARGIIAGTAQGVWRGVFLAQDTNAMLTYHLCGDVELLNNTQGHVDDTLKSEPRRGPSATFWRAVARLEGHTTPGVPVRPAYLRLEGVSRTLRGRRTTIRWERR